jgi:hypothetical protein
MPRPRKNANLRVHDQLHVGLRVPPPLSDVLPRLVIAANADLRRRGLPPKVSLSNLSAHWLAERAAIEEQNVLGTSTVREWLGGVTPEPQKKRVGYWEGLAQQRDEGRVAAKQQETNAVKLKVTQGG